MYKETVIVLAFALLVAVNAAPKPCSDCGDHGSHGTKSFLPFGGSHSLGPASHAVKAAEHGFGHFLEVGAGLFGARHHEATGTSGLGGVGSHSHRTVAVPVPVKTHEEGCDDCEKKEDSCDDCEKNK